MLEHIVVAPAHEGADRGRRGVEDGQAVPVDHLPEAVGLGLVRRALVEKHGRAVREQAIDDVAVPRYPADVGRAEVAVGLLQIEDVVRGNLRAEQVAGRGVQHALGFSGRARGVEDEQGVFRAHGLRLAIGGEAVAHGRIADVPAVFHRHVRSGSIDHDDGRHIALPERGVDVALERNDLAAADALVGGDDGAGVAVRDPA